MIFTENRSLNPTFGIVFTKWESDSDSLVLELDSGNYNLKWKGDNPHIRCLDSRVSSTGDNLALLKCTNSTDIITAIHWAYGTSELTAKDDCSTHMLGECHAGSSKFAIERECLGKSKCVIPISESFFGKINCLANNAYEQWHLIVDTPCTIK